MKNKTKKMICSALIASFSCCALFAIGACGEKNEDSSFVPVETKREDGYALLLDEYTIENYTSNVKVFDANCHPLIALLKFALYERVSGSEDELEVSWYVATTFILNGFE